MAHSGGRSRDQHSFGHLALLLLGVRASDGPKRWALVNRAARGELHRENPRRTARGRKIRSVVRGRVPDDDQANDLVLANGEVVRHNQVSGGQVRPVELAVVAGTDDGVSVVVNDLGDL